MSSVSLLKSLWYLFAICPSFSSPLKYAILIAFFIRISLMICRISVDFPIHGSPARRYTHPSFTHSCNTLQNSLSCIVQKFDCWRLMSFVSVDQVVRLCLFVFLLHVPLLSSFINVQNSPHDGHFHSFVDELAQQLEQVNIVSFRGKCCYFLCMIGVDSDKTSHSVRENFWERTMNLSVILFFVLRVFCVRSCNVSLVFLLTRYAAVLRELFFLVITQTPATINNHQGSIGKTNQATPMRTVSHHKLYLTMKCCSTILFSRGPRTCLYVFRHRFHTLLIVFIGILSFLCTKIVSVFLFIA